MAKAKVESMPEPKAQLVKPQPEAQKPEKVEAKAVKLVQLHYKGDNQHVLDGVHAIAPGLNSIPDHVWEKVKDHPHTKHLIEKGHLKHLDAAAPAKEAAGKKKKADPAPEAAPAEADAAPEAPKAE